MNISEQIKKGQVLIMVLLMMMVLGIILVSTSNTLVKDTQITQTNSKFEALKAYAEKMAFQLGLEYANPQENNFSVSVLTEASNLEARVSEILDEVGWKTQVDTCTQEDSCFKCNVEFDESNLENYIEVGGTTNNSITNPENLKAIARICDSNDIKNAEVFKDEILIYDLKGLEADAIENKTFNIDWESTERLRNLAMEVSVDFIYSINGEQTYGTVKSIYKDNTSNIFSNNINDFNESYIEFQNGGESNFQFSLNNLENSLNENEGYFKHLINGELNIENYLQIRIKPLIKSSNVIAVGVSVSTEEPQPQKVQGRSIEVTLYEQTAETELETDGAFRGPQASVISTVPAAKISGLFDYVLKNESTI